MAVATFVLAVIAIFQQKLTRWLMQPRITLSATTLYTEWADGSGRVQGKVLYLHLRLANSGADAAQHVEVLVEEVYERRGNSFMRIRQAEYPKGLVWSYLNTLTIPFVHPETTKVIAFGHVHSPAARPAVEAPPGEAATSTPLAATTLALEVSPIPLNRSHVFAAGTYRLHVVVGASNMDALHATVDIEKTHAWSETDAPSVVTFQVREGWVRPV